MTTVNEPVNQPRTPPEIGGIGHSVRRKEDDRFVQGAGRYLDDVVLPGMLHMAILRSPVAHARIVSIDSSAAQAIDGVVAVVTGEMLAGYNLAWMPTLSGDTQAVLATDKVRYQGQEVAAVIATSPYIAQDALAYIVVDYDDLPPITSPQQALETGAALIRDEKEGQVDNQAYSWQAGNAELTDAAFGRAAQVITLDTHYPRSHPAPMETCGIVADVNPATGQVTLYMTSQAPHAHRTLFAIVAGLPEENIRIITGDIGGGFGNKVPIYPGYVVATAASLVIGKPVKWVETRSENLISTGFARDYHMRGELAVDENQRIIGLRASVLSDQGAFYADAQPTKFRAGLFHICSGSYDFDAAHVTAKGAYTNKAPGGVAYRCSFRVTEASFLIERLVDKAAHELGLDPAEFRMRNFIRPEQFPYLSPTGFVYDSGDYGTALQQAMELDRLPAVAQAAGRAERRGRPRGDRQADRHRHRVVHRGGRRGELPRVRHRRPEDVRLRRAAGAPDRQGDPQARRPEPGPGSRDDLRPDRRRGARHPGRRREGAGGGHRQRPVRPRHLRLALDSGGRAATAVVSRKLREKARLLAAHLLEASPDDLEWEPGRFTVKGTEKSVSIQDVAFAAYTNHPEGMEAGLEGVTYYDPPNMTYPFGSYIVVVEVDTGDGTWKVLDMAAVDDCGVRINPMIVEGPDHRRPDRGLRQGQHAVDHLRRRRQLHRLDVHGLPGPDRVGDAEVPARCAP
jgi:carbon-monoxide dehydrogenase large subunit